MKSVIVLMVMIGCAVATTPIVTTLYSDFNRNSLHIQNVPPVGGSISAEFPSVRSVAPILSQLAPLALSLGNLGSLSDLASLGELASLGAPFLSSLPSVSIRTVPVSIPIPFPSFTPVTYSARSLVPYPYSIYAGARFL